MYLCLFHFKRHVKKELPTVMIQIIRQNSEYFLKKSRLKSLALLEFSYKNEHIARCTRLISV